MAFSKKTWRAILRVAKPGAFLFCFGGTRTFHRIACAIEDAGWELRDCILWLYGTGFPKSLDVSKSIDKTFGYVRGERGRVLSQNSSLSGPNYERVPKGSPVSERAKLFDGWSSCLKPAYEPIILAMKPLDGTYARNALKWGVSGLNIDGCRIPVKGEKVPTPPSDPRKRSGVVGKDLGISRSSKEKMRQAQFESAERRNRKGRYPANLLLDESAAALLDQQSGDLKAGVAVNRNRKVHTHLVYGDRKPTTGDYGYDDIGGASRFFYSAKVSRAERGYLNEHPTVKPLSLMRYLCKLSQTPTGGVVLDPFMGSGTTLLAAKRAGRRAVGVELERKFCDVAARRISKLDRGMFGASFWASEQDGVK